MKLFTVGLVLLLISPVDGLACLGSTQNFTFSLGSGDLSRLKEKLQSLTGNTGHSDETSFCQVTVSIPQPRKQWIFAFNEITSTEPADQNTIRFQTEVRNAVFAAGGLKFSTVVAYTCFKRDGCDRAFLLQYLDWMMRVNMDRFVWEIADLLLDAGKKSGTCSLSNGTVTKCGSEICQAERLNSRVPFELKCVTGLFSWFESIELKLTTDMNFITNEVDQALKFTCKYNECNGYLAISKMQNYIDRFYNVTSISEVFAEAEPVGTPSSSSKSTSTSTPTSTTVVSSILTTDAQVSSSTTSQLEVTIHPLMTDRFPSPTSSLIKSTTTTISELSLQSSFDSTFSSVSGTAPAASSNSPTPSNSSVTSTSSKVYGSSDLNIALAIGVLIYLDVR